MSINQPQILKLDEKKVFYEDTKQEFFNISGLENPIPYGKTSFKISYNDPVNSSYKLKENTLVLFEVKDANGLVIKSDIAWSVNTDNVNGIAFGYIWVEEKPLFLPKNSKTEYADGMGTLTILGELEGVPKEWEGKYNIRSTYTFEIRKSLENRSTLIFTDTPTMNIDEHVEADIGDANSDFKRSYTILELDNLGTDGGITKYGQVLYNITGSLTSKYNSGDLFNIENGINHLRNPLSSGSETIGNFSKKDNAAPKQIVNWLTGSGMTSSVTYTQPSASVLPNSLAINGYQYSTHTIPSESRFAKYVSNRAAVEDEKLRLKYSLSGSIQVSVHTSKNRNALVTGNNNIITSSNFIISKSYNSGEWIDNITKYEVNRIYKKSYSQYHISESLSNGPYINGEYYPSQTGQYYIADDITIPSGSYFALTIYAHSSSIGSVNPKKAWVGYIQNISMVEQVSKGLNPNYYVHKYLTPTNIHGDDVMKFKLKLMNPQMEVAQDLGGVSSYKDIVQELNLSSIKKIEGATINKFLKKLTLDNEGDFRIKGNLTAESYTLSSSVENKVIVTSSGSTIFGSNLTDSHVFTGSLKLSTGSFYTEGNDIFVGHNNETDPGFAKYGQYNGDIIFPVMKDRWIRIPEFGESGKNWHVGEPGSGTRTGSLIIQVPDGFKVGGGEDAFVNGSDITLWPGDGAGGAARDGYVWVKANTADQLRLRVDGNISASGDLTVGTITNVNTTHITASGNISASDDIYGSKISASSNLYTEGDLYFRGGGIQAFYFGDASSDTAGGFQYKHSSDTLEFYTANGSANSIRMRIKSSGGDEDADTTVVGIGMETSDGIPKTLTVKGDISASGDIYLEAGDDIRWWNSGDNESDTRIVENSDNLYMYSAGDLEFTAGMKGSIGSDGDIKFEVTNGNEKFRYDGGLDAFGIGTTTPSKKLTVAGDISASGYISTQGAITASGNIKTSGTFYGKQFQSYVTNFQDDLGTAVHYIPIGTNNYEMTSGDNDEVGFLAPFDGVLHKIMWRQNYDASATTQRFGMGVVPSGTDLTTIDTSGKFRATVTGMATDTVGTITAVNADSAATDDMTFSKGETIYIYWRNSTDLTNSVSEHHVTVVFLFDTST